MNPSLRPEELEGKALAHHNERVDLRASAEHQNVLPASEFYRQRELARAAEVINTSVDENKVVSEYAQDGIEQMERMLMWVSRAGGMIEYARQHELINHQ